MPPVRDCTAPPEAGKPNCGHATASRPCYLGVGGITFVSQNPTAEHRRLSDSANRRADWKNWGPYLAERAWGTVREDYSASGDAWNHFPHDHARSRDKFTSIWRLLAELHHSRTARVRVAGGGAG